jgi:hypothetical protein
MINRQQDPQSKRDEEFMWAMHLAKQSPEAMKQATPEVQTAVTNQAAFSERRKKYLGGK